MDGKKFNKLLGWSLVVGIIVVIALLYMMAPTNREAKVGFAHDAQVTRDYLAGKPISGDEAWWIRELSFHPYVKHIAMELNMSDRDLLLKITSDKYTITIKQVVNSPTPAQ